MQRVFPDDYYSHRRHWRSATTQTRHERQTERYYQHNIDCCGQDGVTLERCYRQDFTEMALLFSQNATGYATAARPVSHRSCYINIPTHMIQLCTRRQNYTDYILTKHCIVYVELRTNKASSKLDEVSSWGNIHQLMRHDGQVWGNGHTAPQTQHAVLINSTNP